MCKITLFKFPIFKALQEKSSEYAEKIRSLYNFAEKYLNEIPVSGLFGGYTDHSINHSITIISYMQQLMKISKVEDGKRFSSRDLYYAIAAALLHDTGMVISIEDKNDYLDGIKVDENFNINQIFAFKEFKTNEEKEKEKTDFLTAYIRKNHGKRSAMLIKDSSKEIFRIINNQQEATRIADICESHCMSIDAAIANFTSLQTPLMNLSGGEVSSSLYIALILRIADALDISEDRAPNIVRNLRGIDSRAENKSHWDMNAAIDSVILVQGKDYLDAPNDDSLKVQVEIKSFDLFKTDDKRKTNDETILKAAYYETLSDVTQYFLMVKRELLEAKEHSIRIAYNNLSAKYEQYFIDISTSIRFIPEPSYESHIVNMNYKTVLVNLLGNGLYGDSRVGLREIIQNSIDAIKWKNSTTQGQSANNKIIITIDANKDYVSIADNGIGMDKNTITDCLLGIGKSIYNTEGFRISNSQFQHIGYYGIGFFSIFMLCDSVTINSRKTMGPLTSITINDTNSNFFSETILPQHTPLFFQQNTSGTEIVLHGISKFKKAFAYSQIADQPDTSEQCYGEHVQHYLELLFLNDNECKIEFIINETLDHKPSSQIEGIVGNQFYKICDICSLNSGSRHYSKKENIAETLVEYTGKTYRAIYQWNGEKFEEITDWRYLNIEDDKSVDVCTITDWNTNSLILLYVPTKYFSDPFELGVTNYRQRVFYDEQAIIESYTLRQFIEDTKIQPLIQDKNYCIAIIEKMRFKRLATNTILYKRDAYFEESAPLSAIKSGREYLDKLYIRNVLVPESHLCLPIFLVGYNNHFANEIKNIFINVLSRNVVPNIKRDDLDADNLKTTSRMVAELLIDYTEIQEEEKNIIKKLMEEQI